MSLRGIGSREVSGRGNFFGTEDYSRSHNVHIMPALIPYVDDTALLGAVLHSACFDIKIRKIRREEENKQKRERGWETY